MTLLNERKPNARSMWGNSQEWRSQHTDSLKREETGLHSALETASEAHNRDYILMKLPKRSSGEQRLR